MIVQNIETKEITLFTKGADSILEKLLKKENEDEKKFVYQCIDEFSKVGLRTLVFTEKKLTQEQYDEFNRKFEEVW